MSNLNRERLTKQQSIQCYYAKFQLDCAFQECDSRPDGAVCPMLEQVKLVGIPLLNASIEAGVREIYNQYSPSWQHTRNQPGANFPREG